jgi:hypothetical protein
MHAVRAKLRKEIIHALCGQLDFGGSQGKLPHIFQIYLEWE